MPVDQDELLPSFDRPPVGEVALVVQIDQLHAMRNVDFFRLWSQTELQHLYPSIEEYQELPEFREIFTPGMPIGAISPRWVLSAGPARTVARYNFRSNDRKEQFQVQRDRIAFFWHSGYPPQPYPRFPVLLEKFVRDYAIFTEFVKGRGWGDVTPNQCAISYNNVIPRGEGWDSPQDLGNVVTFYRNEYSRPLQDNLTVESANALLTLVRREQDGLTGRMYVSLGPRDRQPEEPDSVELEIIMRGPPPTPDIDGARKFFEAGRRAIVTTFESVTTKQMHTIWGKR